ncbi:MAG: tetratricopeptide repeat protein [Candidatus Omnitrophica bacterium]|nr:tetratricopeptide repeat protein [Candidatus Omnitrophota bacterium]
MMKSSMNRALKNKYTTELFFICFWLLFLSYAWSDEASLPPAIETYNKAVAFYEDRHWDAAKEYLHQYLAEYSDTPLYVTCLYYLAYCYQQLGDKTQAMLLYHKVIDQAREGDAFWADMAQKRIEGLIGSPN